MLPARSALGPGCESAAGDSSIRLPPNELMNFGRGLDEGDPSRCEQSSSGLATRPAEPPGVCIVGLGAEGPFVL